MPSRLQIAKPDIVKAFSQGPAVLRPSDIVKIFNEERASWRLAQRTTLHEFVDFLVGKTELRRITLAFPQQSVSGYTWGEVPLLEALLGLVKDSY